MAKKGRGRGWWGETRRHSQAAKMGSAGKMVGGKRVKKWKRRAKLETAAKREFNKVMRKNPKIRTLGGVAKRSPKYAQTMAILKSGKY